LSTISRLDQLYRSIFRYSVDIKVWLLIHSVVDDELIDNRRTIYNNKEREADFEDKVKQ